MEKQTFDKCYYCWAKRVGKRAGKFEKFIDEAGFEHRMCHKCASQNPRDRWVKTNTFIGIWSNCETKSPEESDTQNPNIVTPKVYKEYKKYKKPDDKAKDNTISPEWEKRSSQEPELRKTYISEDDKKRFKELKKELEKYDFLLLEFAWDFIGNLINEITEAIYHGEGKEVTDRLTDAINLKSMIQKFYNKQGELNYFISCLFEDIPF